MKTAQEVGTREEKKLTLVLLCYFFGVFGVHRFYTGKHVSGVLMLVTFGGVGVWMFVDLCLIIMGRFTDRCGRLVTQWV